MQRKLGFQFRKVHIVGQWALPMKNQMKFLFFQSIGGNAVGMSTVPEIQQAAELDMRILSISIITNYAAGIINKPLSHKEVIEVSSQVKDDFANLLTEIITAI